MAAPIPGQSVVKQCPLLCAPRPAVARRWFASEVGAREFLICRRVVPFEPDKLNVLFLGADKSGNRFQKVWLCLRPSYNITENPSLGVAAVCCDENFWSVDLSGIHLPAPWRGTLAGERNRRNYDHQCDACGNHTPSNPQSPPARHAPMIQADDHQMARGN